MKINNDIESKATCRQGSMLVVELAGPASSGKTTLTRMLVERSTAMKIAPDISVRKPEHLAVFLLNAPLLLPVLLFGGKESNRFTWDEIKSMVYLEGWPRVLREQVAKGRGVMLVDQGPVFRLATLHAFGPAALRESAADKWWNRMFKQWASYLDLIIWLDAPNPVLQRRINARDRWHIVKGKSEQEVSQFLDRYRVSYRHVLQQLSSNGGPKIIPFDTSQVSIQEVERTVLDACDVKSP